MKYLYSVKEHQRFKLYTMTFDVVGNTTQHLSDDIYIMVSSGPFSVTVRNLRTGRERVKSPLLHIKLEREGGCLKKLRRAEREKKALIPSKNTDKDT